MKLQERTAAVIEDLKSSDIHDYNIQNKLQFLYNFHMCKGLVKDNSKETIAYHIEAIKDIYYAGI